MRLELTCVGFRPVLRLVESFSENLEVCDDDKKILYDAFFISTINWDVPDLEMYYILNILEYFESC